MRTWWTSSVGAEVRTSGTGSAAYEPRAGVSPNATLSRSYWGIGFSFARIADRVRDAAARGGS